jgi:hypothetical protein
VLSSTVTCKWTPQTTVNLEDNQYSGLQFTRYGVTDNARLCGDLQSFKCCLCQNCKHYSFSLREGGRKTPYNVSTLYHIALQVNEVPCYNTSLQSLATSLFSGYINPVFNGNMALYSLIYNSKVPPQHCSLSMQLHRVTCQSRLHNLCCEHLQDYSPPQSFCTSETSHIFWNVLIWIPTLYTANVCFRMADLYK